MNVTLPDKNKMSKRNLILYLIAGIVCVIAIIIAVSNLVLGSDVSNQIFGANRLRNITLEEEIELRNNFGNLFQNRLTVNQEEGDISFEKVEKDKGLVFTKFELSAFVENNYDIKVAIPFININSETIAKYNEEIKGIFRNKVDVALTDTGEHIVYTVDYQASVENSILSVVIRSSIKTDNSPQRVMVITYNYDLRRGKPIDLPAVLSKYGLDSRQVESKIRTEIEQEQRKTEDLKELGYNVFVRNASDEKYLVSNIRNFFIYNGNLYIIFAYGNSEDTSEMDLIIL